jgi:hypothetical protein
MDPLIQINTISQAIQLAVAPVFLLTGIGAILSVLAHRLGRIVDRARQVDRRMLNLATDDHAGLLRAETTLLWRRIEVINWAIRLSVGSALLICVVVMCLFLGDFALFNVGTLIAWLFVTAMALLILALLLLLFEVSISTHKMLKGVEYIFPEQT